MARGSTEGPRRTRVERKAETRASLLLAAYDVFTEGSVVTTPMDEVARAAGVSKATLFFHFGSRVELLEAVAAEIYRGGVEIWHPEEPGLAPFLQAYLGSQRQPAARLLWEISDVLTVSGRPGPDVAYLHLIGQIEDRLDEDGIGSEARPLLARMVAAAALWVARRAAFRQATDEEVERFIADVEATVTPWM